MTDFSDLLYSCHEKTRAVCNELNFFNQGVSYMSLEQNI